MLRITLTESNISIGIIKHNSQHITNNNSIMPLNNSEIHQTIINNPASIAQHINNFVQKNNLKKTKAILNIPWLESSPAALQPFIILQVTLCIAASKTTLEKIICNPENNQNKLLPQHNHLSRLAKIKSPSPHAWLGYTFCLSMTASGFLYHEQNNLQQVTQETKIAIGELEPLIQAKQKEVKVLHELKKEKMTLETQVAKLETQQKSTGWEAKLLTAISQVIPHDITLTRLLIEQNKTKDGANAPGQVLTITGLSKTLVSITTFIEAMAQHETKFKKFEIVSLQKASNKKTSNQEYQFVVVGYGNC